MQLRAPVYPQNIVQGRAMTVGGKTSFNDDFPTGPGIYKTVIGINVALTIGTGATPISEGILNFVRQIYFRTDNNETIVDNLPARPLYKIAQVKAGSAPRKDEIAAATATYRIEIPIYHADPLAVRPEDTILDTSRYNSLTLDVILGTVDDLLDAPGTASVVVTCDIDIYRSKYKWDSAKSPAIGFTSYLSRNPIDAADDTEIALERASDLYYKRFYLHTATSGSAGQVWGGTNSDSIIDTLKVTDADDTFVHDIIWRRLQNENKDFYSLESVPSGVGVIDFVRDRSEWSALWSNRNSLKLSWVNQAGVAADSYVSLVAEARRALRPKRD